LRILDPIAASAPRAALAEPVHHPRYAVRSLFAPEMALSGSFVAIVWLLAFFGGPSALFRDADAGWHIRAGEQMIASGALPHDDPYSFSKTGEPWIAWEWASDVAAGAAHRVAGLNGVAFLYMFAIAAAVWIWFRLHWAAGGNFVLACLFAAPLLSTTNMHWLARPHVFGWLFALGAVWFCETSRRVSVVAVFALSALWANMHGSFFLGPAIISIYLVGGWFGKVLWGQAFRPAAGPRIPFRGESILPGAAAALAGTFVNPNGWNLHKHVFAYLTDSALLDRIGEFQSFNFHAAGATQIMLALMIGAAGGFAALSAHRFDRFLLSMAVTAAALRSARMLPVAALILLPLANGSLSTVLADAELSPKLRRLLDRILDYGLNLRTLDRSLGGIALVPFLALALFGVGHAMHPAFPADQFPVAASKAVAALPADARIFSSDKFGGYLIYRFAGARKVFFDGRSDFYGADFMSRYSRLVQARPGWAAEFGRWKFTHALLPPDYALVAALEAQGWTEIYRDRTAVLLEQAKAPVPPERTKA
jgi:hypothetical protein